MLAQFSVVPLGVGESVSSYVAEVVRKIEASGLSYQVGPMATVVEGEPEAVFKLIQECHALVFEKSPRVLTTITIDDRKQPGRRMGRKVRSVEEKLGRPLAQ